MSKRVIALVPLLLAMLLAGCGGQQRSEPTVHASPPPARLMRAGARVFAEQCRTCHPLLGRPNTDVHTDAPPLDLDAVDPTRAYAIERVTTGGVGMGSFGAGLRAGQLRAVVAYVLEVGGRDVFVPDDGGGGELARGRAVYDQHCQRCHAIAGREPTDPNPIWPGTDFQLLRPSVAYVEQKVRDGQREAMPSFRRRLSPTEIHAVARYVTTAAR